jgi:hypothetical protein
MPSGVTVKIRGAEEVEAFLATVPYGAKGLAAQAYAAYLLGNDKHGLKHYPAYKSITRKQAYGKSFETDKQRSWFFWALKNGTLSVPYNRTNNMKNGWVVSGKKWTPKLKNQIPYVTHVMDDTKQSRLSKLIGWRKVSKVISDNVLGAMRSANAAVKKWIDAQNK